MEIYFLRHGPAGSKEAWTGDDADRPLTDRGRELTEQVVRSLAEAGLEVDAIVTSPYARALQTAEITSALLRGGVTIEQDDRLRPGFGMAELAGILEERGGVDRLMLVGHEGDFSAVIGRIIGRADLVLRKSGIAMVDVPDPGVPQGSLRWLVPPVLLG
jgi:phosphohistidine phosphatase